jgi:hypothetical protein
VIYKMEWLSASETSKLCRLPALQSYSCNCDKISPGEPLCQLNFREKWYLPMGWQPRA